jgi:hypothetical protein
MAIQPNFVEIPAEPHAMMAELDAPPTLSGANALWCGCRRRDTTPATGMRHFLADFPGNRAIAFPIVRLCYENACSVTSGQDVDGRRKSATVASGTLTLVTVVPAESGHPEQRSRCLQTWAPAFAGATRKGRGSHPSG